MSFEYDHKCSSQRFLCSQLLHQNKTRLLTVIFISGISYLMLTMMVLSLPSATADHRLESWLAWQRKSASAASVRWDKLLALPTSPTKSLPRTQLEDPESTLYHLTPNLSKCVTSA